MTVPTTEQLTLLVRRKHNCLIQLVELGRQQQAVVERGDVNDLLRILGAKQLLISSVQAIEQELEPFRHDDPDRRVWRAPEDRAACAKLVAECETLFRYVLTLERESEQHLTRRRDDAHVRLTETRTAEAVRGAYIPNGHVAPGILDLTSEV